MVVGDPTLVMGINRVFSALDSFTTQSTMRTNTGNIEYIRDFGDLPVMYLDQSHMSEVKIKH